MLPRTRAQRARSNSPRDRPAVPRRRRRAAQEVGGTREQGVLYVRDVATNAHPFRFVSPKNFGDETLSTAARTCVKKRVGEGQQNALPAKRASGVAAQPAAGPETQKQHGSGAAHAV